MYILQNVYTANCEYCDYKFHTAGLVDCTLYSVPDIVYIVITSTLPMVLFHIVVSLNSIIVQALGLGVDPLSNRCTTTNVYYKIISAECSDIV